MKGLGAKKVSRNGDVRNLNRWGSQQYGNFKGLPPELFRAIRLGSTEAEESFRFRRAVHKDVAVLHIVQGGRGDGGGSLSQNGESP